MAVLNVHSIDSAGRYDILSACSHLSGAVKVGTFKVKLACKLK
jgi:hypothetical protein